MNLRAQIKTNAREAMRGNWGKAAAILLLYAGTGILITYLEQILFTLLHIPGYVDLFHTPAFFLDDAINTSWPALAVTWGTWALQFVLFTPLTLGVFKWFYQVVEGRRPPFAAVFDYYVSGRAFGKALAMRFHVVVRSAGIGLATLFPALCLHLALRYLPGGGDGYLSMMYLAVWILSKLVLLLSMLLWFYFVLRYFLCYFLLAEHPDERPNRLIRLSVREMREYRGEVFGMFLTLIPWGLLCVFVLPALWVVPYGLAAAALYAKIYISRAQSRRDLESTRVLDAEQTQTQQTEMGEGQEIESDR